MTKKACLTHVPLVHRDSLALRYLALIDIQPTLAAQGCQHYECQSYIANYKPLQGRLGTCTSLSAKAVYTLSHPTKVLKNQPPVHWVSLLEHLLSLSSAKEFSASEPPKWTCGTASMEQVRKLSGLMKPLNTSYNLLNTFHLKMKKLDETFVYLSRVQPNLPINVDLFWMLPRFIHFIQNIPSTSRFWFQPICKNINEI